MLSKEEIETMKENLINLQHMLGKKPSISTNAIKNALKYIEQLETERKLLNSKYIDNMSDTQLIGINKIQYKEYLHLKELKQKLIEKLEKDKMEQFDDYTIYLIESYLEIVKGENE